MISLNFYVHLSCGATHKRGKQRVKIGNAYVQYSIDVFYESIIL